MFNFLNNSVTLTLFFIVYMVFEVYGVIFLINDFDISWKCSKSNLCVYTIISLFQIGMRSNVVFMLSRTNIYNYFLTIGIFELCMSFWGGIELFVLSCSDLQKTNLWIYGVISFVIQLFIAVAFIYKYIGETK